MAWDSTRGNLMLFGGGHASYVGNEMYLWQGVTGTWTRGSLPSRLTFGGGATHYVVDDAAPQSAHTYDNANYLPVNDRFLSFGGAAFNTGSGWQTRDGNGNPVAAGPWVYDPSKADANKVGGTDGSGYLPTTLGGQMWANRAGQSTGTFGGSSVDGSSAYRTENGKDVVYVTRDSNASGFPKLYRYEAGHYAQGELDRWDVVATSRKASSAQTSAAIDTTNNLYVRISNRADGYDLGLGVWDLDRASASDPAATGDTFVELMLNGQRFETNREFGIAYDEDSGHFVLWDGNERGAVYYTAPALDADGNVLPTWSVIKAPSTTTSQPAGNFANGVLGKWLYIAELDAFAALDEFQPGTQDAAVWLYKPIANPVPEASTVAMSLLGLLGLALRVRTRNRVAAATMPPSVAT